MKAAVVTSFTEPLQIQDREIPVPGPRQVLVRIEASGVCHTDIHAARGDWPVKPTPPFVPGHEGVGVVDRGRGPASTGPHRSSRVALPWLGSACGTCEYCLAGWETLCEAQQNTGYSVDGALRRVRGRRSRTSPSPYRDAASIRSMRHRCPAPVSPRTRR